MAPGDVDERDIKLVQPDDLRGYQQCHFFAGIAVWSYALRLADWPDDREVWTGSCPCPSFSAAGKGQGFDDPRHLWPDWFRLIRQRRPATVFGEQADDAIGYGWLDLVQAQMEAESYAVGKAVLASASVGAADLRERLYFVADTEHLGHGRPQSAEAITHSDQPGIWIPERDRAAGGMADTQHAERRPLLLNREDGRNRENAGRPETHSQPGTCSEVRSMADSGHAAERGLAMRRSAPGNAGHAAQPGILGGFWANAEWIWCRDNKYRPVEPGTFPLAHGIPGRVGRLRAYGNAIVPQVAAEFIKASSLPAVHRAL